MPPLRNRSLIGALCAGAIASTMVACVGYTQDIQPRTQTVVEVYDRTDGRVLPIYWHDGRRYVVGRPGNEYAVRIRNAGPGRILAVMSVDGVNAITGDTASPQQSGYVLAPYESTDINGWRKSLSRTVAFYFTSLPDSYAARTGRPDNVGVIGVAVFRERARPMAREEIWNNPATAQAGAPAAREAAPAASAAAKTAADAVAQAAAEPLATGHGRDEASYASYTQFRRASDKPAETVAIYYDSYENLLARGIPAEAPPLARLRPDPFPYASRFVPDPSTP